MLNNFNLIAYQSNRCFHIAKYVCNLKKPLEEFNNIHCFKNLYPWKSLSEFADHIVSSVVYNKHGIIAINKPFGVRITKEIRNEADKGPVKHIKHTAIFAEQAEFRYSIEEVLPEIKNALGLSYLSVMKSTERYTSGLVLMSTNERTSARIQKSFNIARNQKIPYFIHCLITVGYPIELTRKEMVGLKYVPLEGGEGKVPEIVTHMSRRNVLDGIVKRMQVEYRTLAVNKNLPCSLMEVNVSSINFHFVRVYASSRAACILGDPMHGSRMKTVFGIPVKLDAQTASAFSFQKLPNSMYEKLQIPFGAKGSAMIPSMIHLQTMILPKFISKQQDLHISAPLPHHFLWTCQQLELQL